MVSKIIPLTEGITQNGRRVSANDQVLAWTNTVLQYIRHLGK